MRKLSAEEQHERALAQQSALLDATIEAARDQKSIAEAKKPRRRPQSSDTNVRVGTGEPAARCVIATPSVEVASDIAAIANDLGAAQSAEARKRLVVAPSDKNASGYRALLLDPGYRQYALKLGSTPSKPPCAAMLAAIASPKAFESVVIPQLYSHSLGQSFRAAVMLPSNFDPVREQPYNILFLTYFMGQRLPLGAVLDGDLRDRLSNPTSSLSASPDDTIVIVSERHDNQDLASHWGRVTRDLQPHFAEHYNAKGRMIAAVIQNGNPRIVETAGEATPSSASAAESFYVAGATAAAPAKDPADATIAAAKQLALELSKAPGMAAAPDPSSSTGLRPIQLSGQHAYGGFALGGPLVASPKPEVLKALAENNDWVTLIPQIRSEALGRPCRFAVLLPKGFDPKRGKPYDVLAYSPHERFGRNAAQLILDQKVTESLPKVLADAKLPADSIVLITDGMRYGERFGPLLTRDLMPFLQRTYAASNAPPTLFAGWEKDAFAPVDPALSAALATNPASAPASAPTDYAVIQLQSNIAHAEANLAAVAPTSTSVQGTAKLHAAAVELIDKAKAAMSQPAMERNEAVRALLTQAASPIAQLQQNWSSQATVEKLEAGIARLMPSAEAAAAHLAQLPPDGFLSNLKRFTEELQTSHVALQAVFAEPRTVANIGDIAKRAYYAYNSFEKLCGWFTGNDRQYSIRWLGAPPPAAVRDPEAIGRLSKSAQNSIAGVLEAAKEKGASAGDLKALDAAFVLLATRRPEVFVGKDRITQVNFAAQLESFAKNHLEKNEVAGFAEYLERVALRKYQWRKKGYSNTLMAFMPTFFNHPGVVLAAVSAARDKKPIDTSKLYPDLGAKQLEPTDDLVAGFKKVDWAHERTIEGGLPPSELGYERGLLRAIFNRIAPSEFDKPSSPDHMRGRCFPFAVGLSKFLGEQVTYGYAFNIKDGRDLVAAVESQNGEGLAMADVFVQVRGGYRTQLHFPVFYDYDPKTDTIALQEWERGEQRIAVNDLQFVNAPDRRDTGMSVYFRGNDPRLEPFLTPWHQSNWQALQASGNYLGKLKQP